MSEGLFEPEDLSRMKARADEIVASLMKGQSPLMDKLLAAIGPRLVKDLGMVLLAPAPGGLEKVAASSKPEGVMELDSEYADEDLDEEADDFGGHPTANKYAWATAEELLAEILGEIAVAMHMEGVVIEDLTREERRERADSFRLRMGGIGVLRIALE